MIEKLESIYRLVVFAVFCLTAWFTIPGIFWPHAVLDVLGTPVPRELVWAGFAFQLVFLVSLYSLPVLIDWQRYLFNAVLGAAFHIALAMYWWIMYPLQTGLSAVGMGCWEFLIGAVLLGLLAWLWTAQLKETRGSVGADAS